MVEDVKGKATKTASKIADVFIKELAQFKKAGAGLYFAGELVNMIGREIANEFPRGLLKDRVGIIEDNLQDLGKALRTYPDSKKK